MQKIAILSDIHGNIAALEKVMADMQRRGVDAVFNLGDHVSGPLWPKETIVTLMAQDWFQIRGNHDRELAMTAADRHGASDRYAYARLDEGEIRWLGALPATLMLDNEFLLCHGTPGSDVSTLLETIEHGRARISNPVEVQARLDGADFQVIVCGHTHFPRVVSLPGGQLIINPGSVGLPAYDYDVPSVHVIETGSPHARYAVMERKSEGWTIDLIAVPYDHQLAADRARKNGRPDWEEGLLTGYMLGE